MRSKLFQIVAALWVLASVAVFSAPVHAQFNTLEASCEAANSNGALSPEICAEGPTSENPIAGEDGVIIKAANIVAIITGIAAIIVIVVAGMTMTLSSGDSSKIRSSRDAIIYASIGLVVVGLARTIVVFLVGRMQR